MEDHVPRHAQMGAWVLINDRWYQILPFVDTKSLPLYLHFGGSVYRNL